MTPPRYRPPLRWWLSTLRRAAPRLGRAWRQRQPRVEWLRRSLRVGRGVLQGQCYGIGMLGCKYHRRDGPELRVQPAERDPAARPGSVGSFATFAVSYSARSNKLSGTLPAALRLLIKMEGLNLRRNRISGTLPAGWGSLRRLRHFSISVANNFVWHYSFIFWQTARAGRRPARPFTQSPPWLDPSQLQFIAAISRVLG